MGEFAARLRQRIEDTETALRNAVSARDVYAVQVDDHGVDTKIHAIAA